MSSSEKRGTTEGRRFGHWADQLRARAARLDRATPGSGEALRRRGADALRDLVRASEESALGNRQSTGPSRG